MFICTKRRVGPVWGGDSRRRLPIVGCTLLVGKEQNLLDQPVTIRLLRNLWMNEMIEFEERIVDKVSNKLMILVTRWNSLTNLKNQ